MLNGTSVENGNGGGSVSNGKGEDGVVIDVEKGNFNGNGETPNGVKRESKSALKVRPVTIECTGIKVRAGKAEILKDIDAVFYPGTITALQGPSGAGKTTLLNVLSGRHGQYNVTCKSLKLNGKDFAAKTISSLSCLVPQHDILIAVLTPRESLYYTSKLVLKGSEEKHKQRVEEVLQVLSLTSCADVLNGDEDIKGISGGQRKRCSIGIELITNPSCLFLDEPTSGLDSKIAMDVIKVLQNLAQQGRTIVCTIHQPSYEMFILFDKLCLLSQGELVYFGDVKLVTNYFETLGFKVPQYSNPADVMLNVISEEKLDFAALFRKSDIGQKFYNRKSIFDSTVVNPGIKFAKKGTSKLNQMKVLIQRSVYVTLKDKKQFFVRSIQLVIMGFILGLTYLQLDKIQTAIFDRQSAMLLMTTFYTMTTIMGTIIAIPMEKTVLKREVQNGFYTGGIFTVSRLFVFFVFQMWYLFLLTIIAYPLVGLNLDSAKHIFIFYFTLLLLGLVAVSLGFFFGTLFPTVQQSIAVVPTIVIPFLLFSGLFVAPDNIPVYFIWMYYISFIQYAYQLLLVNEFHQLQFKPCSDKARQTSGLCPLGACNDDPFNLTVPAESCSGQIVLDNLDYDIDKQWRNVVVLLALWIVIASLAYVGVRRFLRK